MIEVKVKERFFSTKVIGHVMDVVLEVSTLSELLIVVKEGFLGLVLAHFLTVFKMFEHDSPFIGENIV